MSDEYRPWEDWEIALIYAFKDGDSIRGLSWKFREHYRRDKKLVPPIERERDIERIIRDWMNK